MIDFPTMIENHRHYSEETFLCKKEMISKGSQIFKS